MVVGREVYKLRDIQRYCKTRIIPQAVPSLNDVTAIKVDKILDQVKETIDSQELDDMIDVIEMKLIEEDYTAMDLAAALLRMMMGNSEDIAESSRPARSLDDLEMYRDRGTGKGRSGRRNRAEADGRRSRRVRASERVYDYISGTPMARLFLNIGRSQNVSPGDILGAVAGESGIPGRVVGSIDMYDAYTFVEVPEEYAQIVLDAMKHARIR